MTTLVCIDVKSNTYSRYEGKKRTDVITSDRPLPADMVKMFLVDPQSILCDNDTTDADITE